MQVTPLFWNIEYTEFTFTFCQTQHLGISISSAKSYSQIKVMRVILKDVHWAFLSCMAALFSTQFINFECLWKFQVKAHVCLGLIFSLSIAIIDVSM